MGFHGVRKPLLPTIRPWSIRGSGREIHAAVLERGFREGGGATNLIEEAVAFLDGIPGWLAYFGRRYGDCEKDFNTIKNAAVAIALDELSKLSVREKLVLKALANNAKSWSQVRDYILEKHGLALPKSTLSRHIDKLEKLGIIRNCEFLD